MHETEKYVATKRKFVFSRPNIYIFIVIILHVTCSDISHMLFSASAFSVLATFVFHVKVVLHYLQNVNNIIFQYQH